LLSSVLALAVVGLTVLAFGKGVRGLISGWLRIKNGYAENDRQWCKSVVSQANRKQLGWTVHSDLIACRQPAVYGAFI